MFKKLKSLIFTVEEEETPIEEVQKEEENTIVLPSLVALEEKEAVEEKPVTFTISETIKPKRKEVKANPNYDFETIISPIYGSSPKKQKQSSTLSIPTKKINKPTNGIISPMYGNASNETLQTTAEFQDDGEEITLEELINNNLSEDEELVQIALFNDQKEEN